MKDVIALIPSYKADEKLSEAIAQLRQVGFERFVIVNDGSPAECMKYYDEAERDGCDVVHHAVNMGKGRALRTGFNHVLLKYPACPGVVTCDADGQHEAQSVRRAGELIGEHPNALILGIRQFFQAKVPFPNLFGNTLSRLNFFLLCGLRFGDTQCGLRAYPKAVMIKLMHCYGERFDYENTTLLELRRQGIDYVQFPMKAVYEKEGKQGSHYKRFLDSYRIFTAIIRYAAAPIAAGVLSCFIAFWVRTLTPAAAWQAISVLAGWVLLSFAVPEKGLGKWFLSSLIMCASALLLSMVLYALTPISVWGIWWLMAIVLVPLGYSLWNWAMYGKKPKRIMVGG